MTRYERPCDSTTSRIGLDELNRHQSTRYGVRVSDDNTTFTVKLRMLTVSQWYWRPNSAIRVSCMRPSCARHTHCRMRRPCVTGEQPVHGHMRCFCTPSALLAMFAHVPGTGRPSCMSAPTSWETTSCPARVGQAVGRTLKAEQQNRGPKYGSRNNCADLTFS